MASEYHYLVGAEAVERAGHAISRAASEMSQAVLNLDGALERHRQWADEWLRTFEQITTNLIHDLPSH